ncbi:hypothetical protein KFL_005260065 [Klebsormidium nitens]|uniref:Uncharacterized protein n=1 Tax=Klebsormidium nitens TaxID=105231 RepID=A0A1Y1ILG0_KLENI|nr:hypothetical protein KFL_005260065 [Klebsormidium nitens]|eukprot:GAQ89467.1 hypothetical protein KFL_005260065 [Klebsormidium nitens]
MFEVRPRPSFRSLSLDLTYLPFPLTFRFRPTSCPRAQIYDLVLALYITIYILISLILLTLLGEVVAFAAASPRLMGALMIAHWLLTAWLWIWVGLAFDASQVFKGECRILKHYLEDPANTNNALGARLPCGRLQLAQQLFLTGEQDASNVTAQINNQVLPLARALAANSNVTAAVPPPLCDPFANVTTPPGCVPADTFIPQAVAFYRELAAKNPGIVQIIGLNPDQVELLGNATLGVLRVIPDLQDLLFCTSIFATLNGISQHQCHTIRWASNLLWSSLVVCAAGMMPLQLLGWYWIRYMEAVRKEEEILAKAPVGAYRAPASSVDGGS